MRSCFSSVLRETCNTVEYSNCSTLFSCCQKKAVGRRGKLGRVFGLGTSQFTKKEWQKPQRERFAQGHSSQCPGFGASAHHSGQKLSLFRGIYQQGTGLQPLIVRQKGNVYPATICWKHLVPGSYLRMSPKQMDRGDKFLSQELIFRTDDPSSQHRLRMRIGAALQQKHMVPSSVVSPSWEP